MKEQLKENKILITVIGGFLLMFLTDLYKGKVNNFQDMAANFVQKEYYKSEQQNTERRLSRIEQKIDELLQKGGSK